jgi:hypothetical protein
MAYYGRAWVKKEGAMCLFLYNSSIILLNYGSILALVLYLLFGFIAGVIGILFSIIIRVELVYLGAQMLNWSIVSGGFSLILHSVVVMAHALLCLIKEFSYNSKVKHLM